MKQYEEKYLNEKVSRIMAKQKEGHIVIAALKNGSGLPAREDLGVTLGRAAYPYDYTDGNVGFLNYNSDIGAKPGAKLPPVLALYRPLALQKLCST